MDVSMTKSTKSWLLKISELWHSFRTASWLGWQIESNWTDPFLFAVYSIVKPLASAGILVIMYTVVTSGNFDTPMFPYIYLGNAFYIYVGAVMGGISWAVIDDREHYKTLKYMVIAPLSITMYLMGRGVAKFLVGTIAVFITVTFGVLFLKVRIDFASADWGLFFLTLFIGIVMLAFLGLVLAGITLLIANQVWFVGEAVAGGLYLFSGAVFPLDVLPAFLRPIGYLMPITYWLELLRRSLVSNVAQAFPTLAGFSNLQLLIILVALTVLFAIIAFTTFDRCLHSARERGMIDMVSNY
jgi:ABC-2 type transport system permease protein